MSQKVYDAAYEEKLMKYFDSRLPDKMYDAHFHISRKYCERTGYNGTPYQQFVEFSEKYTCRPVSGGMVMPQPSSKHTTEELDDENAYNLALAKEQGLAAGLIIRPQDGREKAEKMLDEHSVIKVLKPYLTYSQAPNMYESDILDFAPEWMWQLAHDREMPILIHLSHYQDGLSHPKNIEQIQYLCKKYPRAKLVLAHCAMGHHIQKLIWGLEGIKGLDNIWFDCSGSTEAVTIYHCIKNFGVEKMMNGGDFDHGANVGRICSFGSSFIGFHDGYVNEDVVPPDYRYQPLNNTQECLIALLQAAEILGLSDKDMEKICYSNGAELYK